MVIKASAKAEKAQLRRGALQNDSSPAASPRSPPVQMHLADAVCDNAILQDILKTFIWLKAGASQNSYHFGICRFVLPPADEAFYLQVFLHSSLCHKASIP